MKTRNYSHRTIQSYVCMLANIAKFFKQSPEKLTVEQIKKYLYYCKVEKGYSVSTINQTISALKILFQDVIGLQWDNNIRIKRPRKNRHLPEILSLEEISRMVQVTGNLKHKAILAVLYSSGIRREELLNLKIRDVDSKRMLIRISNGKGNRSRDTILAQNTLKIIRTYYNKVYPKPQKYLFEGYQPGVPYSASSVGNIVKRAVKRSGITKHIHIHSLRHAFATHLLEEGINLKVIQKLLGHTSLRSTTIYLHLAKVDPNTVKSPFDKI